MDDGEGEEEEEEGVTEVDMWIASEEMEYAVVVQASAKVLAPGVQKKNKLPYPYLTLTDFNAYMYINIKGKRGRE